MSETYLWYYNTAGRWYVLGPDGPEGPFACERAAERRVNALRARLVAKPSLRATEATPRPATRLC